MTEFAEVLPQLAKMGNRSATSQLVEGLQDPTLDFDIFEMIIKNVKDCEEVSCKSMDELLKDDGFQEVLARDEARNNEDHGSPSMKNVCEALQSQVELCREEAIMFQPEQKERLSEVVPMSMTTNFSIGASSAEPDVNISRSERNLSKFVRP